MPLAAFLTVLEQCCSITDAVLALGRALGCRNREISGIPPRRRGATYFVQRGQFPGGLIPWGPSNRGVFLTTRKDIHPCTSLYHLRYFA